MVEKLKLIAPYNLWGGRDLPVGFVRREYLDMLVKYLNNRLIKVLTGQRRVGKSFIMRQVAMRLVEEGTPRENILFINMELAVLNYIQTSEDLLELVSLFKENIAKEGRIYLFVDEIQEIDGWEKTVNSLSQDYTLDVELFISGSNSKLLSGELASLLSGRYVGISVYPFSFEECRKINGWNNDRTAYLEYMRQGGFPELHNLPDAETRTRYVEGLRDSILLKDVVKRHSIKDVGLLENLFSYLVNNSSSLISISSILNYMKSRGSNVSYDTIASYIVYLQESFLVYKSERYNIAGKSLLGGNFKIYPCDQSYHNYLFPGVRYGRGYMLEGMVYMELLRKGYKVHTGVLQKGEIDFVATKGARTLFIQVAYQVEDEATMEREYAPFRQILGVGEKILITMDDDILPARDGVRHIQAWNMTEAL